MYIDRHTKRSLLHWCPARSDLEDSVRSGSPRLCHAQVQIQVQLSGTADRDSSSFLAATGSTEQCVTHTSLFGAIPEAMRSLCGLRDVHLRHRPAKAPTGGPHFFLHLTAHKSLLLLLERRLVRLARAQLPWLRNYCIPSSTAHAPGS